MAGACKFLIGGLVLAACAPIFAQPFDLSWYTIDGGGGTSSGGVFVVNGTVGQPDAGVMSGGSFQLSGGFWTGTPKCDSVDFNRDGIYPDSEDLFNFLDVFGGAPCPSAFGCNDLDFNNDQIFPDIVDLEQFLFVFGGGSCV